MMRYDYAMIFYQGLNFMLQFSLTLLLRYPQDSIGRTS